MINFEYTSIPKMSNGIWGEFEMPSRIDSESESDLEVFDREFEGGI